MPLRATENAVAGHIWPAGRYLPIPGLWAKTSWEPLFYSYCVKQGAACMLCWIWARLVSKQAAVISASV